MTAGAPRTILFLVYAARAMGGEPVEEILFDRDEAEARADVFRRENWADVRVLEFGPSELAKMTHGAFALLKHVHQLSDQFQLFVGMLNKTVGLSLDPMNPGPLASWLSAFEREQRTRDLLGIPPEESTDAGAKRIAEAQDAAWRMARELGPIAEDVRQIVFRHYPDGSNTEPTYHGARSKMAALLRCVGALRGYLENAHPGVRFKTPVGVRCGKHGTHALPDEPCWKCEGDE